MIGPVVEGKARLFEDQYICSSGQLYQLAAGYDRFVADLRPCLESVLAGRGQRLRIFRHPYNVCTALVAHEIGVILTDAAVQPLNAPLDTTSPVAWIGYANAHLRASIEPVLQAAMQRYGLS